ncbi:hypothetical protein I2W78_09020 [Streptomyces spinoverrucosus]|uniref:hypothetical protein n=1 Tax=Streptomyces spinoverrucosus TaxID=284043 RepID=UPI0018C403AE|nr:hypothetical protein [Streptomyces spinoverrucosus]MBG0851980.1 hypothetical protein [Streptomyces spinoverrucosus]
MRQRPDVVQESSTGEEVKQKRIDLSVPQVASSAVAAVVAAKLASSFGVYGTILGAGVVSVIATCGGSLFQHFFTRTGEQFRDVAAPARPPEQAPRAVGEFTEGTVYRARVRSWKRPLLAAALVFGVTMTGITAYELASGSSFGGRGGTTVGDALSGHGKSSSNSGDSDPDSRGDDSTSAPSGVPDADTDTDTTGGATPSDGASSGSDGGGTTGSSAPTPSASSGDEQDTGGEPAPTPTPTASATTPAPSASSRSETAVPDPAGPAAP